MIVTLLCALDGCCSFTVIVGSLLFALFLTTGGGKLADALRFLFLIPFYAVTITLEKYLPIPVGFPKRKAEILAQPEKFFQVIQSEPLSTHVIPSSHSLHSLEPLGRLEEEPGKNSMACMLKMTTTGKKDDSDSKKETRLFVKFQTDRGTGLFIRSLIATFGPTHKELEFYRHLSSKVPIKVPTFLGGGYSRSFQRVLIVLKLLESPWATLPDWKGASLAETELMVTQIAKLHAMYWQDKAYCADTSFLRNDKGLDWIGVVSFYFDKKKDPPFWAPVWYALDKYFKTRPRCLSHGDCRPGNMLFKAKTQDEPADVIFADWEATAFTPFLWDVTYCGILGLPLDDSSTEVNKTPSRDVLLERYLRALVNAGVDQNEIGDFGQCKVDCDLLTLALLYYATTLVKMDLVGKPQGNTEEDGEAWGERIFAAIEGIDWTKAARALNVEFSVLKEFKEWLEAQKAAQDKKEN